MMFPSSLFIYLEIQKTEFLRPDLTETYSSNCRRDRLAVTVSEYSLTPIVWIWNTDPIVGFLAPSI